MERCPSCAGSVVETTSGWFCARCNVHTRNEKMPLVELATSDVEAPPVSPASLQADSSPAPLVTRSLTPTPSGISLSCIASTTQCPVCQDAMCNTKTACGHQFCEACINAWLREHLTCPLCRNVIAPSHVTVYRTNDASAHELIVHNSITGTLTYGLRCRWTVPGGSGTPCQGRVLQRLNIATGTYEPRECRSQCRGTAIIPPPAVRNLASALKDGTDPSEHALTVSDEELPNEEALVAQHSLASGQFGGKWTWKTWLLLILSVPALMFIYWLVGMLEAHLIVWLLS